MGATQPSIGDIDGDGLAEIVFGTSAGRVYVYQTGLRYDAALVQWATVNGNYHHTGRWSPQPKPNPADAAR